MLAFETEALATEAEAETKAFTVETEAKTKVFSLEAEARTRRLKFQRRRDRAEALLRLETVSRPRCVSRHQDRGHIPAISETIPPVLLQASLLSSSPSLPQHILLDPICIVFTFNVSKPL